jgi:hypothetical protein
MWLNLFKFQVYAPFVFWRNSCFSLTRFGSFSFSRTASGGGGTRSRRDLAPIQMW